MTVEELINELKKYNPHIDVKLEYDKNIYRNPNIVSVEPHEARFFGG